MFILGLTGSIGTGKSTAAAMFRRLGVPVHDSDAAVHALTGPGGGAVAAIDAAFPSVVNSGVVDRQALGARVFDDAKALKRLEAILHPMVRQSSGRFLAAAARRREALVVLDIPLLFETGGHLRCDAVAVVHCPPLVQVRRVLARPGMTAKKFAAILAKQMPSSEKCRLADFVFQTGLGKNHTLRAIQDAVTLLAHEQGRVWAPSRA
ncbi:MAG: dephospho-CoA kinase [Rhodospirillaceae bacterium]